ncbi:MAG: S1C family serine protease [Ornithinibacter sp.]
MLAAVVAAVLLIGGLALANTLRSPESTSAAPPKPTSTATPTLPSSPPRPTPSVPLTPSPAPSAPGVVPGAPPTQAPQTDSLTPQQSKAAAAVSPGLVDVVTTIGYDGAQGAGTGIVLSADGLVLTNHHVVTGATSIRVTDVGNGKTYDATVLGYDSTHDVAVLRLKEASGLTVAPLGSSASVRVGDEVVAVGNAGGVGGTPSAVAGTVRALDQQITVQDERDGSPRRLSGMIRFDAAIAPGDSGGAVVDEAAKVVGMVTAGSSGAGSSDGAGMVDGYAVPIDQARSIAQQIIEGRSSSTVHIGENGFLGVQVAPDNPLGTGAAGAEVAGVVPESPADRAGIQEGDVVTTVDGDAVTSAAALHDAMSAHRPGDRVLVAWTDATGTKHTAHVRLGSGPVG